MHVCNLYMACVSCLSAGRSQSVVIIMYNDLHVDLWFSVKFITSCSSWIIEIRLVAWHPGVTNKMEFLDGHRSRSRPGGTSMKEPYYFTIYVYLWLLCFLFSMHVRMVERSLMSIKRIAIPYVHLCTSSTSSSGLIKLGCCWVSLNWRVRVRHGHALRQVNLTRLSKRFWALWQRRLGAEVWDTFPTDRSRIEIRLARSCLPDRHVV